MKENDQLTGLTRRCTRTIFPLRSKIAGELGRYP